MTVQAVQDDTATAYGHCRDLLERLGLPVLSVPGNHDVRGVMREVLPEPPFAHCGFLEFGNWLVAGIDSCAAGRAGGIVTGEEFARMKKMIEKRLAPAGGPVGQTRRW